MVYYIKLEKFQEYESKLKDHIHYQNKGNMIIAQQITEDLSIKGLLAIISL